MKVALTGANGFLGAHIAKAFIEEGHSVIALVRASADLSTIQNIPGLIIENIDYRKELFSQFSQLKEKHGELDLFIHNAGVTVSLNSQEYFDINSKLSGEIVKSLETAGWVNESGKILYVSSLTVAGPRGISHPVSKYGESKKQAEKFFEDSKYQHLIIRPTAIYGAGDYAFLPLIKGAISKVYPVTNKTQKMSMVHGKDLAGVILEESKTGVGLMHVSDGITYTHDDFIAALSKVLNKKIYKIPISPGLSKIMLGISDFWHKLTNKRPSITLEKFQEITHDWNSHEDSSLKFSKVACKTTLEEGFQDAYEFYKSKKLL